MTTIAVLPRRQTAAPYRATTPLAVAPGPRAAAGAAVTIQSAPFRGFGWAYIADGAYTVDTPLEIGAGAETQITIDGRGASTDTSFLKAPFAGWPFWSGNKFQPFSIGDNYTLRLDFNAKSLAINNAIHATLKIGSTAGPVFDDYESFGVGAGVERNFRFDIELYAKTTFKTNGAQITVTPDAPVQIYAIGLYVVPRGEGGSS